MPTFGGLASQKTIVGQEICMVYNAAQIELVAIYNLQRPSFGGLMFWEMCSIDIYHIHWFIGYSTWIIRALWRLMLYISVRYPVPKLKMVDCSNVTFCLRYTSMSLVTSPCRREILNIYTSTSTSTSTSSSSSSSSSSVKQGHDLVS